MTENTEPTANQVLQAAKQAMRTGQRAEALRQARLACRLAPEREEPWLILSALSAPKASVEYLRKALEINPQSQAAKKGMQWAVERLRASQETKPVILPAQPTMERMPVRGSAAATVPTEATHPVRLYPTKPILRPQPKQKSAQPFWLAVFTGALVIVLLVFALWFIWPDFKSALTGSHFAPRPVDALYKPSLTPTSTPTFTPTPTSTPTSTPTFTPTPTNTSTPTSTPTETPIPPTEPPVVYNPYLPEVGATERWIDIDLSEQMLYAYVGEDIVNRFLVSTGTYLHPTVQGLFRVYVKYLYTDMAGPGYYLPDVSLSTVMRSISYLK